MNRSETIAMRRRMRKKPDDLQHIDGGKKFPSTAFVEILEMISLAEEQLPADPSKLHDKNSTLDSARCAAAICSE